MAHSESSSGLPRRQIVITMACAMTGLFLAALDQTVVGTAMPRIIADLGGFDRTPGSPLHTSSRRRSPSL